MSHYKPYPAYKDSGVEWIGPVPEHWVVKPICRVASCNDDSLPEDVSPDQILRYVDISSVNQMDGITDVAEIRFADAPSRARRQAKAGDVVISTVRTYLKAVAAVAETHADCTYSTGFAVLRPRPSEVAPTFLKWLTLNDLVIQAIEAHSEGLSYPAINATELVKLKAVVPPRIEQTAIAAALDRETARIDALIAKKTRFIELLKEKRQALITHAVTKGLDPKVKMKDSGVEWIGEVPEHWATKRLKFVSSALTVGIVVNPSEYIASSGLPFIYGGDITEGRIDIEKCRRISALHSEQNSKTQLNAGDLLMVRVGYPGVTAVVPTECEGGNCASVMLIRKGNFASEWLCYALNSRCVRYQIEVVQYGAAQEQFNIGHAVDFVVPVPPLDEQRRLVKRLQQTDERFNQLLDRTERSITLLKERRSALITAAVTGQIDLREAV